MLPYDAQCICTTDPRDVTAQLVTTQLQEEDAQRGSERANCNSIMEKQANTAWINLLGCRLEMGLAVQGYVHACLKKRSRAAAG